MKNHLHFLLKALNFFLVVIFISSCAALGTRTLYKTEQPINFENPGVVGLTPDTLITMIYPATYKLYRTTVVEAFKNQGYENVKFLGYIIGLEFENPSKKIIADFCMRNELDALLLSKLTFINTVYSAFFIKTGQNWDTEVEMKLFDSKGNLLISTKHNTYKGNTYWNAPKIHVTVRDGTYGALTRIFKEIQKNNLP